MNNLRTAAQQMMSVLDSLHADLRWELDAPSLNLLRPAEAALKAALEQPKQKPYLHFYDYDGPFVVALMAPRDQVTAGQFRVISRAIEAALKELNHE
jgi:hypothetical protein